MAAAGMAGKHHAAHVWGMGCRGIGTINAGPLTLKRSVRVRIRIFEP